MGQQAAVGIFNRKVFLVDLHGGNQHFSGQCKKTRVEVSGDRHRPFIQGGNFLQQVFFDVGDAVDCRRGFLRGITDQGFSLLKISNDFAFLVQDVLILFRAGDGQFFGRMEAVSSCSRSGFQPQDFGFNDLIAVEQDRPMHGSDEFCGEAAPAHSFGDRQACDALAG